MGELLLPPQSHHTLHVSHSNPLLSLIPAPQPYNQPPASPPVDTGSKTPTAAGSKPIIPAHWLLSQRIREKENLRDSTFEESNISPDLFFMGETQEQREEPVEERPEILEPFL